MKRDSMKVIAVGYQGTDDALFLRSLLDSHPAILSLPGAAAGGVYEFLRGVAHELLQTRKAPDEAIDLAFAKDRIATYLRPLCEPGAAFADSGLLDLGESRNQSAVVAAAHFDYALGHFIGRYCVDIPDAGDDAARALRCGLLIALYRAYEACLGRDTEAKTSLLYPSEHLTPDLLAALMEDFPGSAFIIPVEDPVARFDAALYQKVGKKDFDAIGKCFTALLLEEDELSIPGIAYAVPVEAIHSNPKRCLTSLMQVLGLPWSNTLLRSTFSGQPWWGRRGGRRVHGFERDIAIRRRILGSFDAWRVGAIFSPLRAHFGYAPPVSPMVRRLAAVLMCLPFSAENAGGDGPAWFWRSALRRVRLSWRTVSDAAAFNPSAHRQLGTKVGEAAETQPDDDPGIPLVLTHQMVAALSPPTPRTRNE